MHEQTGTLQIPRKKCSSKATPVNYILLSRTACVCYVEDDEERWSDGTYIVTFIRREIDAHNRMSYSEPFLSKTMHVCVKYVLM